PDNWRESGREGSISEVWSSLLSCHSLLCGIYYDFTTDSAKNLVEFVIFERFSGRGRRRLEPVGI
ncbi:MAG: hypothetical protein IKX04_05340, partial [Clostridiales bacterium]|nr:hypothetical protein [Clostridiales bacterium]